MEMGARMYNRVSALLAALGGARITDADFYPVPTATPTGPVQAKTIDDFDVDHFMNWLAR